MTYRQNGKNALDTILQKDQNVRILEKQIYTICSQQSTDEDVIADIYARVMYQTIGDILNGTKLNEIFNNLKSQEIGWKHPMFKQMKIKMDEQDEFIKNPFEVEEGVLECRCGSKRVFSYSKQCRGADEPMTTFAQCVACKSKWSYSG